MKNFYFLEMLTTLRTIEELILHVNIYDISEAELEETSQFLALEYEKEIIHYPHLAPAYDKEAALFGAQLLYYTAQLVLYREQRPLDLKKYFALFNSPITASASLSADLSLRFIPHLLKEITLINADDELIPLVEASMRQWPYSSININFDVPLEIVLPDNACLFNLFTERVIEFKKSNIALQEPFQDAIKASMGNYGHSFWSELFIKESNE